MSPTQITGVSARFPEGAVKPLRQRSGFQPNPLEVIGAALQYRQQCVGFARYLYFANNPARLIHNADACLPD